MPLTGNSQRQEHFTEFDGTVAVHVLRVMFGSKNRSSESLKEPTVTATNLSARTGTCLIISDVFEEVAMKNAVFWNIKTRSYLTGNILPLRYSAQPVKAM
jgi:hypothetical protein